MTATKTSSAPPLGVTLQRRGATFALFSREADKVELCLFDAKGREVRRHAVAERTGDVWHDYLPSIKPGQLYGYRVYGSYAPDRGLRFNGNKLLIDPYARALHGNVTWHDSLYGYKFGDSLGDRSFDKRDSAPYVPKGVVTATASDNAPSAKPRPWAESVVYELHVKGFTQLCPDVAAPLRGTIAALGSPRIIEHLARLGVTAVELLPVHAFMSELPLVQRGLTNYWGYNSLAFFALHNEYLASGEADEFRMTVEALHKAGIEVILDVVFNHTAEGSEIGPTLSFRGIDNRTYYRLDPTDKRRYLNFTGCGNTLDGESTPVARMVVDCLHYWVHEFGIDGFRFDLATALVRDSNGVITPNTPLLRMISADPILRKTRLIAEPWDATYEGYGVGRFPARWAEWNDRYRDTVRRYWNGSGGLISDLAQRMSGSSDLFNHSNRGPAANVNFITSHDGFTLDDLVSYNAKHNATNGEDNRDGDNNGNSFNYGVEGPSDDPEISALRHRQKRNLLATLLLSRGVPMLRAGDELSQSQGGNNNAYCQDNEISWLDWGARGGPDRDLTDFIGRLTTFRRGHKAIWENRFLDGIADAAGDKDVVWLTPDGREMSPEDWRFPNAKMLAFMLSGRDEEDQPGTGIKDRQRILIVLNAHDQPIRFRLPILLGESWRTMIDTSPATDAPDSERVAADTLEIACRAVVALTGRGKTIPGAYDRSALNALARAAGIADGFHDIAGTWHAIEPAAKGRLLDAMGLLDALPADPSQAIAEVERNARTPVLDPTDTSFACHIPGPLQAGGRAWGFSVQLYGLCSSDNWGIGDFGDLRRLVEEAARLGANAIQLNPLHALFLQRPNHISPYAPSSRIFLNALYIDVEETPDFAECEGARARLAEPAFQESLVRLRTKSLVDYPGVAAKKLPILRLLYRNFRDRHLELGTSARALAFKDFVADGGERLNNFAVFEALSTRFASTGNSTWQSWPVEFRNPRNAAVQNFAHDHSEDVGFALYLQWIAAEQLHRAADLAKSLGMTIGLIADLAVGAEASGADAWCDQDLIAFGAELGAPPDQFNADGQCWGVPPWRPQALRNRGYQPFIDLLRGSMSWAGGLRIDHVMGLERQFWVPRGCPGRDGGYVAFPFGELSSVLAQESVRHRCLVIGEDLGTVPEGFRDRLARAQILSTRVLYFERESDGRYRPPDAYPLLSVAHAGTHDLPPIEGYLAGSDIDARKRIGLYRRREDEAAARAARNDDVARLSDALAPVNEGAMATPTNARDAIHRFLAKSGSGLALIQIEDAVGQADQANLPGTIDEYPNWRRKYAFAVDELAETVAFKHLADIMAVRAPR